MYLTYPFVLSWSLLEAMSCECAIIGSATEPVMDVIEHGVNGLLVDFFNTKQLATSIYDLLQNREHAQRLGRAARAKILKDFDLDTCVQRQIALIELVAGGIVRQ